MLTKQTASKWLILSLFALSCFALQLAKAGNTVVGTGTPASCAEKDLQNAVDTASAGATISFNCGTNLHSIKLTQQIVLTKDLTFDGGGTSQGGLITLDGGNTTRILHLGNQAKLTVRNLTFKNGRSPTSSDGKEGGGAIFADWRSTLTVNNCRFEGNDGTNGNSEHGGGAIMIWSESTSIIQDSFFSTNKGINGGAINSMLSGLTVSNSSFLQNDSTSGSATSRGYGGAIYTDGASDNSNPDAGEILIQHCRFEANKGAGQGGGLFLFLYPPDKATIENSTISQNQLTKNAKGDALGGGIRAGNGTLTLKNTAITSNTALVQGGGLWLGETTTTTIINTTFWGNKADDGNKNGLGGAMLIAAAGPTELINATLANNYAGFMGGALWGTNQITFKNTLIANNTAGNQWNKNVSCGGAVNDGGNNLQFPAKNPQDSSDSNCTNSITIADPLLAPLANNGGETETVAFQTGSPALDAANNANCPATDQRGFTRIDGKCDIGAFEVGARNETGTATPTSTPNSSPITSTPTNLPLGTVTPSQTPNPSNAGQKVYLPLVLQKGDSVLPSPTIPTMTPKPSSTLTPSPKPSFTATAKPSSTPWPTTTLTSTVTPTVTPTPTTVYVPYK